jgi:hypothetical protein
VLEAAAAVQHQQPGGVALRQRLLCDRGLGELEVEVGEVQNSFFCGPRSAPSWGAGRPKCS